MLRRDGQVSYRSFLHILIYILKKKLKIHRFREAIDCFKRALLSADMHDITICDRLARLYNEIDDQNSAAVYHQRIIDTSLGLYFLLSCPSIKNLNLILNFLYH